MFIKDWKKEVFTVPNVLSLFRLALIPVYIVMYLNAVTTTDYYLAAAVLAVSCLTDMIDGKIARHFNMISTVGKVLDPFADKATQFTLIVCLAVRYPNLWYLVALFAVKEIFQLVAGLVNYKKGKMLKGALMSGKICTTVLFLSLIVMVMIPNLPPEVVNGIALVDGTFLIFAFSRYAYTYFSMDPRFLIEEGKEN